MVTTNPVCLLSWLKPKSHPSSLSDTYHDKRCRTVDWWSHRRVTKPLVSWQVALTEGQSHVVDVWVTSPFWLMPSELTETARWGHAVPSWLSQSPNAAISPYVAQSGFDTQTRCYQGCWRPTCFLTPFSCGVEWTLAPSVIYYRESTSVWEGWRKEEEKKQEGGRHWGL